MVGSPTGAHGTRPTIGAGMSGADGAGGRGAITGLPARLIPQYDRIDNKVRREATRLAGLSFTQLPPREATRMAYNVLLRRDPDPTAWDEYTGSLTDHLLSYDGHGRPDPHVQRIPGGGPARRRRPARLPARQPVRVHHRPAPGPAHHRRGRRPHLGRPGGAGGPRLPLRLRRAGHRRPAPGRPAPALQVGPLRRRGHRPGTGPLRVPVDGRPVVRRGPSRWTWSTAASPSSTCPRRRATRCWPGRSGPCARAGTWPSTPRTAACAGCSRTTSSTPTTTSSTPSSSCATR